ncbi:MAG: hypothetical protein LBV68_07990, partial [Spirochaetaceae bacterium]|nr:hypothetical protein [Spirochaetaceae bacterium]
MKNKKICYFTDGNLSSSVIAALLLLVMSTGLFAESLPPPDVWQQSFDRSVFDYHFSRADRETSPERWMEQAKQGMGFAKSAWEEMVFVLYEDINLFQEDSQKLDAWSEDELERRFSQWLVKRFFADDSSELVIETSRKVRSSNLNLLYYLDESGNIIYDELSGDPFVIRPDNDTRDFSSDKILYNDEIDKASKENFFTYTKRLEEYFPELLSFIQEDRRTDFEEKLKGVLFKTQENLAEEFERAKTREDRIFTSLRTGDIWSLRKKSDKEAAGIISAELILETEALCEKGIAELQQRIDRALADSESLVLDGEEWLSQYTDQFYRGLQAWQDAEERFFIRRIEWEQSAGQYWLEGQEAWLSAFNTLAGEKEKWEIKTQELFKAGEALFKNVSLELEQSITKAREEFITEAALRAQSAGERAGAYLDTYISCGTLLSSAQSFIDFWLADMGDEGKNAPQLSDKSFKAWMEAHGITEQSNDGTKREIYTWYSLYNTYLSLALNARNVLIEDFYLVMGEGRLIDVLNENASGEDFYLDEYQVELLRAQAVSNYWAKRLEMAQAVNDYAVELSAGRTTNIEGIQNWEKAKSEYDSALKEYESEIENLKNAENDLIGAKAGINEAYEHLSEAEFALNNLNEKYSILQSIYSIKDAQEIVFDEMSKKYKEILLYEEKL